MNSDTPKLNLLGLDKQQIDDLLGELGEKPFRTVQLMKWIYHRSVLSFDQMTDISKKSRELLAKISFIELPVIKATQISSDGTIKWLLEFHDHQTIEMVYIPTEDRGTLCVSTQVGCSLGCKFCATATLGLTRNLTAAEIVGQVFLARQETIKVLERENPITNIVLMGMGEPLLNFNNSIAATNIMMDDLGFNISKRRVTISTAGIVPAINKMKPLTDVSLAVSLHAANNRTRDKILPINKKYPLEQLIPACKDYIKGSTHRTITWEYVMLNGINDSDEDAKQLVSLIKYVPSKINLIPFNTFIGCDYKCSSDSRIERFANIILEAGITVTMRKSRGDDIDAACGQLAGKSDKENI
ncbi:MAG: 23S rRNA (adenine(2503)-C(2))-methyltransferase RlmN [Gammaproteobacteria bacterium]|nr:MAG: 23S rRNA (adenine(2503)-C(2))-methyltransferase RlmN [Gammaproteobacteria bacterium]